jgi:serine/threonine-protein kinase RsbT
VPALNEERRVPIDTEGDIVMARQVGREMASQLGFGLSDLTLIATAISEITRNIVDHAGNGEIEIKISDNGNNPGITIIARDKGPGIEDIGLAMQDGYTSKNGLGLGLPGSQRIMDEFQISSEVGEGTTIVMKKWKS